jgi:hypothetical protein
MISDDDAAIANRVTWIIGIGMAALVITAPFAVAWLVVAFRIVNPVD